MEYTEWDQIPRLPRNERVPYQSIKVTVKKLCHITHDEEYREITKDTEYVFKPRQKFGKVGYPNNIGEQMGKSYVRCGVPSALPPNHQTKYQCVREDEEVLPGYYIWWSIDHLCFPTVYYSKLTKTIRSEKYGYYSSEPFRMPIKSHYGNHKITCNLKELLQCYQTAYGSPLPRIEFRCGGTLRYRNEICYVVIVCAEKNLSKEEFPVMWEEVLKDGYGSDGKVESIELPQVIIRNGILGYYEGYVGDSVWDRDTDYFSWDTYAFAFHFPDETFTLEPKSDEIFHEIVQHDGDKCLKRKPNPSKKDKLICPNDLHTTTGTEEVAMDEY